MIAKRSRAEGTVSVLFAIAALASCQSTATQDVPLPASPAVVTVRLEEYSVEVGGSLQPGRVVFELTNSGQEQHDPGLALIDANAPPIDVYLRETQRTPIQAFAGVNPIEPGRTATFAADLQPGGRYVLICFARTTEGLRHFEKGMAWETRVGN